MSNDKIKMAKAGEEISAKAASKLRKMNRFFERLLTTKESVTVKPKSDATSGQWICADCGEVFQNNMGAHMHSKSHRRVWWTGTDFEEP